MDKKLMKNGHCPYFYLRGGWAGLVLVGLVGSCALSRAGAEQKQVPVEFELGEVVVTATRAERKIWQVPASVAVITEEEIKHAKAKNVPDLLKDVAGIKVYDTSGTGSAGRINMRGFWGGMSSHNLVLIDGLPINRAEDKLVEWNYIPLDNIERIEIVKGASSALYGENAFAGVINIITKKGSPFPQFKISSSLGSFGAQNYMLSTEGMQGNLNYFFNFSKKLTQGFRKHNHYEDMHGTGKLRFFIDHTSDFILSLGYHTYKQGAYPWALSEEQLIEDRTQARPGTEDDKRSNKKIDFALTYDKDLGRLSSLQTTLYLRNEDAHTFHTSGSPVADPKKTKENIEDEKTFGATFQYDLKPKIFGLKNFFILGLELERGSFDCKEYDAPFQVRGPLKKDYQAIRDKIGAYFQDEIEIISPLFLTLGIRYDQADYNFIDYSDTQPEKILFSIFSPKAGLVYLYGKNSGIFLNAGRAFRNPTLGQLFTYASANPELNPEQANNYELGIRHQFGSILTAGLSLYWMEINNEIWYDYAEKKYKNYGSTSHKGAELSLEVSIIKGLKALTNYTYTCAKNESGAGKGYYLQYVPEHAGNITLRYETGFGLAAQLGLNCVGSSYLDAKNTLILPGYNPLGLRISYEQSWYSLFLAIDNLLDEQYFNYGYLSGTKKYYAPAPGRTFSTGLALKF